MRSPVLVAVGLVVVVVAGCAPVVERARSAPVAAPPFASEEEALATATEAYQRYVDVTDRIGIEGGVAPERMTDVAEGDFLTISIERFAAFESAGKRQIGTTTFRNVALQQMSGEVLAVYLCEDIAAVDIVDAEGVSLVLTARPDTNYYLVEFTRGDDHRVRVSSIVRWDERSC